jgi:hypothetical protein
VTQPTLTLAGMSFAIALTDEQWGPAPVTERGSRLQAGYASLEVGEDLASG